MRAWYWTQWLTTACTVLLIWLPPDWQNQRRGYYTMTMHALGKRKKEKKTLHALFWQAVVLLLLSNKSLTRVQKGFILVHWLFCAGQISELFITMFAVLQMGWLLHHEIIRRAHPASKMLILRELKYRYRAFQRYAIVNDSLSATEMSVNHVSQWLPNPCVFPTVHN